METSVKMHSDCLDWPTLLSLLRYHIHRVFWHKLNFKFVVCRRFEVISLICWDKISTITLKKMQSTASIYKRKRFYNFWSSRNRHTNTLKQRSAMAKFKSKEKREQRKKRLHHHHHQHRTQTTAFIPLSSLSSGFVVTCSRKSCCDSTHLKW